MDKKHDAFQLESFPATREGAIDLLREAQRKHMIHGLMEVDVTVPRSYLRQHKARTGETLSFTAFVVKCLAQAVDEDKQLHAYRRGKRQLVVFDEVDVNTMVEREIAGQRMGTPNIIRAANKKAFQQIHEEIRAAQATQVEQVPGMEWFRWAPLLSHLPTALRAMLWHRLARNPQAIKRFAGTVGVTAVGMFGKGGGWGLTIPFLTLNLVLGGISEKPVLVSGHVEAREHLCITVSVDHDVVDGAQAARFSARLRDLIEHSFGLAEG